MSGYILIYDQGGANDFCVKATQAQIHKLADDRSYRIELFSQKQHALHDHDHNPIRLFVIPGGNYREMEETLFPIAGKINQLVTQNGMNYLGICAGGIAACQTLLLPEGLMHTDKSNLGIRLAEQAPMHLNLYSGSCAGILSQGSGSYGTQLVEKASPIPTMENRHIQEEPYPLYFQSGIFFLGAEKVKNTSVLFRYSSYELQGCCLDTQRKLTQFYNENKPAAAIKHQNGTGNVVLSGVHPELSAEIVHQFPAPYHIVKQVKQATIKSLECSTRQQSETMKVYLDALSITTKPS